MRTLKAQAGYCSRIQIGLVVVLMVMSIGFYVFGYMPADSQLRKLIAQKETKERDLSSSRALADQVEAVEAEVESLKRSLDRFDKKLPPGEELAEFIRDIYALSNRSSLKKMYHVPGVLKRSELYSERPISLSFEGTFFDVASFLLQTEKMERLMRIKSMSIKSRDAKLGIVEVQISMNIYFTEG